MDSAERIPAVPPATHESVGGVAAALWRKKFWIIVPTAVAFGLAMLAVSLLTPRYTGEARVLLENRETVYSRPDRDTRGSDPAIDPEAVASQVQNVMSKDLALKVIHEMGLHKRAEYDPVQNGVGLSGTILIALGLQKDPRTIPQDERVLEMYFRRLLVYPLGKSRVIAIEFQSQDPQLAANVANRIAEEYLAREEGAKTQTSRVTSEWLEKAVEPLMKRVQQAEAKVEAFRSSKGLFVSTNNTNITTQQLSELNTQLSLARSQQADLQARAKIIRDALRLGKVFETSEIINNELVRRLLEQRASLKAQIALEERTLLPGHPRMKELASQLQDLEGQVRAAAERAARAFENDSRAAGARVTSMQAELDNQKKATALSNEDEVQLKALERDALALREQLNSYRNKFLDAAARSTESTQPADARVISRAFPQSEPTFPKKIPIILLATLGTLVVSSTLIATQALMARQAMPAYLDAYGYDMPAGPAPVSGPGAAADPHPLPWEAQKPSLLGGLLLPFGLGRKAQEPLLQPPAPAVTPGMRRRPGSETAPADLLAAELAMMDFTGQGKVVLVFTLDASPQPGLSALRFARRLAEDGAAVVVDLVGHEKGRSGNLFSRLLPHGAPGLGAWLDRVAPLGDIIHRDARSRLHVIPAGMVLGAKIVQPTGRNAVVTLVEALRQSYTHIVIELGALGGPGEFFTELGDVVIVLSQRPDDDPVLQKVVSRLEACRDAPVYVLGDETGSEHAAANDTMPRFQDETA
ncbi:MAG: exopolysaccharide transport family protein [Beijerinckiaceae bacterium]|nr:exopolysaccharide transport family protein [Beijerinckiaceae bacterium]MCZ8301490.1 exopolysaccharide transport family protein [Beijerinckiaceae bacterium]